MVVNDISHCVFMSEEEKLVYVYHKMSNINTEEFDFVLGDITIKLFINSSTVNGINYINLHQNEVTSKAAGSFLIQQYGGRLVFITHGDGASRNVEFHYEAERYEFDPNRIFDDVGAEATLRDYGSFSEDALRAVRSFAGWILDFLLPGQDHIVALHNNLNSDYSFQTYFSPPASLGVLNIYPEVSPQVGTGEFFYTTVGSWFDALKQKEIFNIVLQNNDTVEDDGSLSVYAGMNGIPYSNVEAEHGHLADQVAMLSALQSVLFPKA